MIRPEEKRLNCSPQLRNLVEKYLLVVGRGLHLIPLPYCSPPLSHCNVSTTIPDPCSMLFGKFCTNEAYYKLSSAPLHTTPCAVSGKTLSLQYCLRPGHRDLQHQQGGGKDLFSKQSFIIPWICVTAILAFCMYINEKLSLIHLLKCNKKDLTDNFCFQKRSFLPSPPSCNPLSGD